MTTTTQIEWCYVKNENGSLWLIDTTPSNLERTRVGGWKFKGGNPTWIRIDPETHKPVSDTFKFERFISKLIDLSDIPEPESYEAGPIVVTIKIVTSTSYYYIDSL